MKLAIVDDHTLFRKGLQSLIEMAVPEHVILFEADNGEDLQKKINAENQPDIILMDINMPHIDGYESVTWLNENFPLVNVLVVSMVENEESIVRMLRLGVKGYLCKDVEPAELGQALRTIMNKGFYYTDHITGMLVHSIRQESTMQKKLTPSYSMNDRELSFLQFSCSELTYQEIAEKMFLSPKTVDGYRNTLFERFGVKSRVGLVIFAIREGLVSI